MEKKITKEYLIEKVQDVPEIILYEVYRRTIRNYLTSQRKILRDVPVSEFPEYLAEVKKAFRENSYHFEAVVGFSDYVMEKVAKEILIPLGGTGQKSEFKVGQLLGKIHKTITQ